MAELTDLTRDLVRIPSHEDETAAGTYIEEWLAEHAPGTVERDDHGNVIARRGSGELSLAFVGHHDVVPPADSQRDGEEYAVDKRDGRLYGRGTADMKGAVAAAMLAFRDADPDCELVFASFVGEETGGRGARGAIEDGFAPSYAIVGEGSTGYSAPGVTDVAVAHKGRRASTVVASGEAAHASEPEAGKNAIYRASNAVDVLRDCSAPETEVLGESLRGSVVVTEIEGGSAWNVVPERCEITVDERTVPDERAGLAAVEEIPGVQWSVDQDLPPMACDDPEFADLVHACARDSQGSAAGGGGSADGASRQVSKPHATDAGWLARAGTTCVVCGPAEPGEAHTDDESVGVDVLERCYELYRRAANRADTLGE
jgi:acetylornithine deacetylase